MVTIEELLFMLEFKGHMDTGGVTWFRERPRVEGGLHVLD